MFKARNKPFVLVFWSRDPDGSQHNTGDSLNSITPGINGPTSLAGIRNADDNLAQLRKALDELGLAASTNIIISSDHGFSTISKESKTSPSTKGSYEDTPSGFLPMGFLSHRPCQRRSTCRCSIPTTRMRLSRKTSARRPAMVCSARIPAKPDLVVATNGGSDLIYLPGKDRKLAARTVKALLEQDYVSGLFVDDDLGRFPGTLPMSQLGLKGKAVTPHPSIVVNFRSWSSGCEEPTNCSVADRRYHAAAGPGHAWQLQPRRHHEFHGGDRPGLQGRLCRRPARQQRRCRRHRGKAAGPRAEAQRQTDRPGDDGSDAQRRHAAGVCRHRQVAAVSQWPAHRAEFPARRHPALFRRGGISGPHPRARAEGGKQKTAGK